MNTGTIEQPTSYLRFVQRHEPIHGHDQHGNAAAIGQRPVRVLQQKWTIQSGDVVREEWRDVPLVE